MSNILLAFPNRADSCVLSAGNWLATADVSRDNMKSRRLGKVARTTNAVLASTLFAVDLGAARSLRMLSLVRHNLTTAAKVRVRLSNTSAAAAIAAPDYDSAWVNAKQLTFYGDQPSDWGSRYAALVVFAALTARYLYVEIDDTTNPAGYVEIGRLFVGGGFQPQFNANRGMQAARQELSTVDETQGGEDFGYSRRRPRTQKFTLAWASQAEADRIHEMQDQIGTVDEVFYVSDPANLAHSQRYGFLGRLRELGVLEAPNAVANSISFEMKERL
jgi:hypothetical protein